MQNYRMCPAVTARSSVNSTIKVLVMARSHHACVIPFVSDQALERENHGALPSLDR